MDCYSDISSDSSISVDLHIAKTCKVCKKTIDPFDMNFIGREESFYHGYCLYKISCKHIRYNLQNDTLMKKITFEYEGRLYCDMPCAAKKTNTPYSAFPHCFKCKQVLVHNVEVRAFEDRLFHNECVKCTICKMHVVSGENVLVFDNGNIQHNHNTPCVTKNRRTLIQPFQKRVLRCYYLNNKHPANAELEMISKHVNISVSVCKVWFQNQRARVG